MHAPSTPSPSSSSWPLRAAPRASYQSIIPEHHTRAPCQSTRQKRTHSTKAHAPQRTRQERTLLHTSAPSALDKSARSYIHTPPAPAPLHTQRPRQERTPPAQRPRQEHTPLHTQPPQRTPPAPQSARTPAPPARARSSAYGVRTATLPLTPCRHGRGTRRPTA